MLAIVSMRSQPEDPSSILANLTSSNSRPRTTSRRRQRVARRTDWRRSQRQSRQLTSGGGESAALGHGRSSYSGARSDTRPGAAGGSTSRAGSELTQRIQEVLALMIEGISNRKIAQRLGARAVNRQLRREQHARQARRGKPYPGGARRPAASPGGVGPPVAWQRLACSAAAAAHASRQTAHFAPGHPTRVKTSNAPDVKGSPRAHSDASLGCGTRAARSRPDRCGPQHHTQSGRQETKE
jgi:hypothetical protein